MSADLSRVLSYHQATKHGLDAFAPGPGYLDWANQPDPYRRYQGAELLPLPRAPLGEGPTLEEASLAGQLAPVPLSRDSVGQLLFDSLALSVWKQAGPARWALRVNPSSGNLHPTEAYLIAGPVPALASVPCVYHYAPDDHGLEVRARLTPEVWRTLSLGLPVAAMLVGLSSIHWREAWKYGERAFRYCQHDLGHAIACLGLAAAGLGWRMRLLDHVPARDIRQLLGLQAWPGVEAEAAGCLLAIGRDLQEPLAAPGLPAAPILDQLRWRGRPNRLSGQHVTWPLIDDVEAATARPAPAVLTAPAWSRQGAVVLPPQESRRSPEQAPRLRKLVRSRRSAVAMDGCTTMAQAAFWDLLAGVTAGSNRTPFSALPWPPQVHLVLMVHRIEGLAPGLYCLVRCPPERASLQEAMHGDFVWNRLSQCPEGLEFYELRKGDLRQAARVTSCGQSIAADGCVCVAMVARFEPALVEAGPWFYRRLFWECGMVGQMLYLGAEAAGLRGCGLGCTFDDEVHHLLGLADLRYQCLYHFTVGGPVEDPRITDHPAYA